MEESLVEESESGNACTDEAAPATYHGGGQRGRRGKWRRWLRCGQGDDSGGPLAQARPRGGMARRGEGDGGVGGGRGQRLRERAAVWISSELETPASAFGWLRGAPSVRFDEKEGWGRGI